MAITCFKSHNNFGCQHLGGEPDLTVDQLMAQVTRGHAKCAVCGQDVDLRKPLRTFPVFGRPEELFGLDSWRAALDIDPADEPYIKVWDIASEMPYQGRVLYFNQTPMSPINSGLNVPWILGPQNAHQNWGLVFRVFVPKSSAPSKLSVCFVVMPPEPLEPPLELAIRAVGHFHHGELTTAAVLLCASVEASLRERLVSVYKVRGVGFAERQMTLAQLLERARLLLSPTPGPILVGDLLELGRARNPSAHGGTAPTITRDDVADWMVSAALVYEWSKHATSVYDTVKT